MNVFLFSVCCQNGPLPAETAEVDIWFYSNIVGTLFHLLFGPCAGLDIPHPFSVIHSGNI